MAGVRGREPALDGVRAVAVLAVLAYHQGFSWARGGFLGVSTFFTLSGFLITGLLVSERDLTGRVSLRRFWTRRARRLLPAALLTIFAIACAQLLTHHWHSYRLRGDLFSALGYVANWRFAYAPGGYSALFDQGSPVQHFWSLAVEEQFYVMFPLLVLGAWWVARRARIGRRSVLAAVLAAVSIGSFVLAWTGGGAGANDGYGYYATTHRAGELLLGGLAAIWWAGYHQRRRRPRADRALALAGVAGLVWLIVGWASIGLGDAFVFHGGVEANAVATVAVVLACLVPGPIRRLLGWRPFAGLGRISYATYLFHWPLFAFVTAEAGGFGGFGLFLVRVALVVSLAAASFRWLEEPILSGRPIAPLGLPVTRRLTAGAIGLLLLVAVVAVAKPPSGLQIINTNVTSTASAPAAPPAVRIAYGPLRVMLVGDSLAFTLLPGLQAWPAAHPTSGMQLTWRISMGCPLSGGAIVKLGGKAGQTFPDCGTLVDDAAAKMATDQPDVVLVVGGFADLGDHKFTSGPLADGRWHHLGQPDFDAWELSRLQRAADLWEAQGVRVVWATMPVINVTPLPGGDGTASENDPARLARYNALVRLATAGRAGFTLTDLGAWMATLPGGALDPRWRSDGVHLTVPAGADAVARHLLPLAYAAVARPVPPEN